MSLITVSPGITAFHSCLANHDFDQVKPLAGSVGFETAIFRQCSPGTVKTQRLYPLRHGPRRARIFWSYKSNYLFSLSGLPQSGPYLIFVIFFNWNHFEMMILNLRINFFYFIADSLSSSWLFLCCFFLHLISAKFHLWPSSGDLPRPRIGKKKQHKNYQDEDKKSAIKLKKKFLRLRSLISK